MCRDVQRHMSGHVNRHTCRHVYRHECRYVYRHTYRYMYRHVCAWTCVWTCRIPGCQLCLDMCAHIPIRVSAHMADTCLHTCLLIDSIPAQHRLHVQLVFPLTMECDVSMHEAAHNLQPLDFEQPLEQTPEAPSQNNPQPK